MMENAYYLHLSIGPKVYYYRYCGSESCYNDVFARESPADRKSYSTSKPFVTTNKIRIVRLLTYILFLYLVQIEDSN